MKVIILVFSFILCVTSSTGRADNLSDSDISGILRGEIIIKESINTNGIPGLIAAFSVSSTRENIWNTFIDYENFPKIFDGVKKLRVLNQDENGALVEFWIDAVLSDLNYTLYRKYDKPNYKLTWRRTAGDLKVIEGSWQIIESPSAGKKIVIYSSYVEVGRFIPTKLVRWGAIRKAEEMCLKLREWIAGLE